MLPLSPGSLWASSFLCDPVPRLWIPKIIPTFQIHNWTGGDVPVCALVRLGFHLLLCLSQFAAVYMACATMAHGGMGNACVLLDILAPAVTKVSSAVWGSRFFVARAGEDNWVPDSVCVEAGPPPAASACSHPSFQCLEVQGGWGSCLKSHSKQSIALCGPSSPT